MKRHRLVLVLILVIFLTTAIPAMAANGGRYQAIQLRLGKKSEYNIFILDTREGHMWLLETKESRVDGRLTGGLKYHGKLRPGKKAGDMVFNFGKTE